jgi:antirestriction protein ArdC
MNINLPTSLTKYGEIALIHRVYTVFNAKQIEGIPAWIPKERSIFEVAEAGERILENSGATILHDQADRAFYNRVADRIHLPPRHAFHNAAKLLRHRTT